ncbi:MAG: hypothetical protein Kow00129_07420 [Thermoleophilia bacterium]
MRDPSVRMRRVNEALRELIGTAVQEQLKDPRIGFVTVTGVKATTDLRYATVYVSVYGKDEEKQASLKGLRSAEGFLQDLINREFHFKRTPKLDFVYDTSIDEGMKIHALLQEQKKELGLGADDEPADEEAAGRRGTTGEQPADSDSDSRSEREDVE